MAAAVTTSWASGLYGWQGFVTKDSDRITIGTGSLTILPDLAALSGSHDPRSHVKKTLDMIEAAIEGNNNPQVAEYEIAGRKLKYRSLDELIGLRRQYKQEYAAELSTINRRKGIERPTAILARFGGETL